MSSGRKEKWILVPTFLMIAIVVGHAGVALRNYAVAAGGTTVPSSVASSSSLVITTSIEETTKMEGPICKAQAPVKTPHVNWDTRSFMCGYVIVNKPSISREAASKPDPYKELINIIYNSVKTKDFYSFSYDLAHPYYGSSFPPIHYENLKTIDGYLKTKDTDIPSAMQLVLKQMRLNLEASNEIGYEALEILVTNTWRDNAESPYQSKTWDAIVSNLQSLFEMTENCALIMAKFPWQDSKDNVIKEKPIYILAVGGQKSVFNFCNTVVENLSTDDSMPNPIWVMKDYTYNQQPLYMNKVPSENSITEVRIDPDNPDILQIPIFMTGMESLSFTPAEINQKTSPEIQFQTTNKFFVYPTAITHKDPEDDPKFQIDIPIYENPSTNAEVPFILKKRGLSLESTHIKCELGGKVVDFMQAEIPDDYPYIRPYPQYITLDSNDKQLSERSCIISLELRIDLSDEVGDFLNEVKKGEHSEDDWTKSKASREKTFYGGEFFDEIKDYFQKGGMQTIQSFTLRFDVRGGLKNE